MINAQTKCPTCGTPCTVTSSGLELVENTGDETLATKHYHPIPSFEEIHGEQLEKENNRMRDLLTRFQKAFYMGTLDDLQNAVYEAQKIIPWQPS